MHPLSALVALALGACADVSEIEQVNIEVNHTRPYANYTEADKRYLKPG